MGLSLFPQITGNRCFDRIGEFRRAEAFLVRIMRKSEIGIMGIAYLQRIPEIIRREGEYPVHIIERHPRPYHAHLIGIQGTMLAHEIGKGKLLHGNDVLFPQCKIVAKERNAKQHENGPQHKEGYLYVPIDLRAPCGMLVDFHNIHYIPTHAILTPPWKSVKIQIAFPKNPQGGKRVNTMASAARCEEKIVVVTAEGIDECRRAISRLFFGPTGTTTESFSSPAARIADAGERIAEGYALLDARKKHPEFEDSFRLLEKACEGAEGRMRNFSARFSKQQ